MWNLLTVLIIVQSLGYYLGKSLGLEKLRTPKNTSPFYSLKIPLTGTDTADIFCGVCGFLDFFEKYLAKYKKIC